MKYFSLGLAAVLISGCASMSSPAPDLHADIEANTAVADALISNKEPKVTVEASPYVNPVPFRPSEESWLSQIEVSITEPTKPLSARELVRALKSLGINFSWQIPLESYQYNGIGLNKVPAKTALRMLFGSMGLDYVIHNDPDFVEITPMIARSWSFNVNDRTSEYEITTETNAGDSGDSGGSGGGGGDSSGGSGSGGSGGGGGDGGISGLTSTTGKSSQKANSKLVSKDDLWTEIGNELEKRLRVLMPKQFVPEEEKDSRTNSRGGRDSEASLFDEVQVGRYSINRSSGTVAVQAPRYLLDQLDTYFTRLELELSTVMEFQGRLVLVTTTREQSRGMDIGAVVQGFSEKIGVAFSNNVLGGLTISSTGNMPFVGSDGGIGGANAGVVVDSKNTLISAFIGYLSRKSDVQTIHRPYLSTTSNVPVTFSEFDKTYVNLVSEQSTINDKIAQTSRTNTLVPFEFGTSLRINPRYNIDRRSARAQISVTQVLRTGFQPIDQVISNGQATQILTTNIPLDRRVTYQGETVIPADSLIVLGGQTVREYTASGSGITGLKDSKLVGGVFGQSKDSDLVSTYYFLLSMKIREPAEKSSY